MWITLVYILSPHSPIHSVYVSRNYFHTYCTIQRPSVTILHAKFFGFIHFVSFFMEFLPSQWISQLSPSLTSTVIHDILNTLEKLLWIQLFWMKKMKFYCIEHTKLWSEIKCMYLCAVAKYARWIYEFASANICTVPMFAKYKSDGRHWCFYIQLAQILCEIQLIHN